MRTLITLALGGWLGQAVLAQSINIDWGDPSSGPDPSYAAAALAGSWNLLDGSESTKSLVGLDGLPVKATVTFWPPTPFFTYDHPMTSGNMELLLDDAIGDMADVAGHTQFDGLQNGLYRVYTYAWYAQDSTNKTWVWTNESFTPQILTGELTKPEPMLGVTHAVHQVAVTKGSLRVWFVSGYWIFDTWVLNGTQLVHVSPLIADINGDCAVDQADLGIVLSCYETSNCGDLNGDDVTDQSDLGVLLSVYGQTCP